MMDNTIRKSGRHICAAKLAKFQLLQRDKIERLNLNQQLMSWDNQWIEKIISDKQNRIWTDQTDRSIIGITEGKTKKYFHQLGGCCVMFTYNDVGAMASILSKMHSQVSQEAIFYQMLNSLLEKLENYSKTVHLSMQAIVQKISF